MHALATHRVLLSRLEAAPKAVPLPGVEVARVDYADADALAAVFSAHKVDVTGIFTETVPWLVGYTEHGKIRIVGKGEAQVSFTSVSDIAGFVAYVLEDRIFPLEGERACLNELGVLFHALVEHVNEINGELSMGEVKTRLLTFLECGAGSTGWGATAKAEEQGRRECE
ncbi:hypothetical protein B0H15DRAFT_942397 [Mycena belliarum]|uniref:Uncharacterized protein n=1 Tax=Mycena belliarum TaxID=1033014 RepID=A0AAD6UJ28_9AGAR|nr:hypothetical protein B0H15DRAFT_942397 [Mycena belliae]